MTMVCLATAVACGSEASNPEGTGGAAGTGAPGGAGGAGGAAGGAGGADVNPRICKTGNVCAEGAECSYWGGETGVSCHCDPSGHVFCDPGGGGGNPPWPPCTEGWAKDNYGACAPPATTCTETNGWCTRTCTCGTTSCEMTCDGDGAGAGGPGVLCDASYCDDQEYGGSCTFIEGDCDYQVVCNVDAAPTVTGFCP